MSCLFNKGDVKSALTIEGGAEEKNIETQLKGNLKVRSGMPPAMIDTPNPNFDAAGQIKIFLQQMSEQLMLRLIQKVTCIVHGTQQFIYLQVNSDGTLIQLGMGRNYYISNCR